jgi:hypothetical protein
VKLNLYRLRHSDSFRPIKGAYNYSDGFVIVASSEEKARQTAATDSEGDYELPNDRWLDPSQTVSEELGAYEGRLEDGSIIWESEQHD